MKDMLLAKYSLIIRVTGEIFVPKTPKNKVGHYNKTLNMKKLFYLVFYIIFISSCSEDKDLTSEENSFDLLSMREDEITLVKIPIFNSDSSRIIKMRYEISYSGLTSPRVNE